MRWLVLWLAVVGTWCVSAEELTFEAETAGICGFRSLWDVPIMTAEDGVRVVQDQKVKDQRQTAPFNLEQRDGGKKPAALAFDALQRRLLVRFPGAAKPIHQKLDNGHTIAKVELVLPFKDEELWPEGSQSGVPKRGGYNYRANWNVDKLYRQMRPTWHAVAAALRQPWTADPELGPTWNAYIHGAGYWQKFGAKAPGADRVDHQFGPTPVNHEQPAGRMDVTACLTDEAFGATVHQRLRRLADCGFIVRKWETYDHRYFTGVYEWATACGGNAIIVERPKLVVTLAPPPADWQPPPGAVQPLPPAADIPALAKQLAADPNQGGKPTAVMPTREELAKLEQQYAPRKQDWMSDTQWRRVQELAQVEQYLSLRALPFNHQWWDKVQAQFAGSQGTAGGEPFYFQFVPNHIIGWNRNHRTKKVDALGVYESWVDQLIGRQPRGWHGFEASRALLPWFVYRDALPGPAQDAILTYWHAWLMPDRETAPFDEHRNPDSTTGQLIHPMADQLANRKGTAASVKDTYYAKTGDWRGNKSFYRSGFNYVISTTNFNNTASTGALLGGAIIGSEHAMADGRHGQMTFPLKLWTWYDGTTQEEIDHYYFSITMTAQKMIADFGPEHFDRMVGQSMLRKSMAMLVDDYHPKLHRFIAGSSRTATEHVLITQDGLYSILHSLSEQGVLRDLETTDGPEGMPIIGRELPPAHVARQALVGPWGPDWLTPIIDAKPLPYRMQAAYKQWGGHAEHPIQRHMYLGENYGLYSANIDAGNVPILAQWRHRDTAPPSVHDIATMFVRFGVNETRWVNDAGGWIETYGEQATLQHDRKLLVLSSPLGRQRGIKPEKQIKSIQSSIALYNYQRPRPLWRVFLGDRELSATAPTATAKAGEVLAIDDDLTWIGIIPLPATNLGRRQEVAVHPGNRQEYYGRHHATAALVIDNYNLQQDEPLGEDADWDAVDRAGNGFYIELADANDYPDFAAFRQHLQSIRIDSKREGEDVHRVQVRSGDDTLALAVHTTAKHEAKVNEIIVERSLNGADPDLPPEIDRDSTLFVQGHGGRLEKNGATLTTEPGRMAFLQTEPTTGTVAGFNVLAELADFHLDNGQGQRVQAQGKVSICAVTIQPRAKLVEIDCAFTDEQLAAEGRAKAMVLAGCEGFEVRVNGRKVRTEASGEERLAELVFPKD